MTFVSDSKTLRAFDPVSGWELTRVESGVGFEAFQLKHSKQPTIEFVGRVDSRRNTGRKLPDGRPETEWNFEVHAIDNRIPSRASAETKALIRDALYAYGWAFTGPIGLLTLSFVD